MCSFACKGLAIAAKFAVWWLCNFIANLCEGGLVSSFRRVKRKRTSKWVSSFLQVDSEEPVFEAVLNWVKHKRKEREPNLSEMLEFVRMPLLTPRYITDVIDAEVGRAISRRSSPFSCDIRLISGHNEASLALFSPSSGVACHAETSSMKPRNFT